MRTLHSNELSQVAGAITVTIDDCYTTEYLTALHEDASREANLFGIGAGLLAGIGVGAATNYFNATYPVTGLSGVLAATAAYSYVYIASYDGFELWPWNF